MTESAPRPPAATATRSVLARLVTWIYAVLVAGGAVVTAIRLIDTMASRSEYATPAWVGAVLQAAVLLVRRWSAAYEASRIGEAERGLPA